MLLSQLLRQYQVNQEAASEAVDSLKDGIPILQSISSWMHKTINSAISAFVPYQIPEAVITGITAIIITAVLFLAIQKISNHGGKVIFLVVFLAVLVFMFAPFLNAGSG